MDKILKAFTVENIPELRRLSREYSRRAAMEDSEEMANRAVLSYFLSKVLQKEGMDARLRERIIGLIKKQHISEIYDEVARAIPKKFIMELPDKARIKIAARIHGHGVSLKRAAEMTNAPLPEVMDYVGKTMIAERIKSTRSVKSRLAMLRRRLFDS